MLMLLYWTPFHALFLNNDLVVFQPKTRTATDLGYAAIITTFYFTFLLSYLFQHFPLDLSMFPSFIPTPPPHQSPFVVVSTLFIVPVPPLLYRCKTLSTWMSPRSATCLPLLLVTTPCAAWIPLLPFHMSIRPPFAALVMCPCPFQTLGGSPIVGPTVSLCPLLAIIVCCSDSCIFWSIRICDAEYLEQRDISLVGIPGISLDAYEQGAVGLSVEVLVFISYM